MVVISLMLNKVGGSEERKGEVILTSDKRERRRSLFFGCLTPSPCSPFPSLSHVSSFIYIDLDGILSINNRTKRRKGER